MPWIDILDQDRKKVGTAHLCMPVLWTVINVPTARRRVEIADGSVARSFADGKIAELTTELAKPFLEAANAISRRAFPAHASAPLFAGAR